ncbi:unnamed protein product [Parnassius mnemosyne]|uniref:Retrotransposon gag domain-containing protein n=1 Tax=Parnassius mnemosyne TaxID=213953 RepID=A0AAV1KMF1_9NEOP
MSYEIQFLSLQKNELSYEVAIRGGTPGENVQELRRQIVKLANVMPSDDIIESGFEFSVDVEGIRESLIKVETNLKTLSVKYDKNLYKRTQNLLNHLFHRIQRLDAVDKKSTDILESLRLKLNTNFKNLEHLKPDTDSSSEFTDALTITPSPIVVTCDRAHSSDLTSIKFDGKTCVLSFVQRINDYITARGIPSSKIIDFGTEIFVGDALHWFRSVRSHVTSWDRLCELLKDVFVIPDHDYRLLDEIKARTQGETENITIYLAIMSGMFSRLFKKPSEEDQLEIIMHNIKPCYASALIAVPDLKSIEVLRTACKNYENVQSCLNKYHEPPKINSATLAPEFAFKPLTNLAEKNKMYYSATNKFNCNKAYNNYNKPIPNSSNLYKKYSPNSNVLNNTYPQRQQRVYGHNKPIDAIQYDESKQKFCPRCRVDTHNLRQCTEKRKVFCFKCGRDDYTFYTCPDCTSIPSSSKN